MLINQNTDFLQGHILQPVNPLRAAFLPPRLSPLPDDAIQQNESGLGGVGGAAEFVNALSLFTTFFG